MTAIGVIGCGMVSHAYLGTIARASDLQLKALASRTMTSAERQAALYGGAATSVEALLADPDITIVVNLVPPALHHEFGRRVLEAGKHLYCEKPFAVRLEEAHDLLALAEARGLKVGCAPDTFMGAGHQLARRLVDDNVIGTIIGGAMSFGSSGMESWHPDPAFFYAPGGGPLLDIGPYYITQLVNLLGPVAEVIALGTRPHATRLITAPDRAGQTITVGVPTTVNGAILFESGANVALALSWDVAAHDRPAIELHGTHGSMHTPDPNRFGGAVRISNEAGDWRVIGDAAPPHRFDPAKLGRAIQLLGRGIDPLTAEPVGPNTALNFGDLRGLGVLDLVSAIREDRPPRASGQLAAHVLEVLLALQTSAQGAGRIAVRSTAERPAPMPHGDL